MNMDHADQGMAPPTVIQIAPSVGPFERAAAIDLDPAPDVVEVALEAKVADIEIAPGRVLEMWTYNGQLPGPRIEARAGDTVRVRFKNSLPEATTIHWHGLRVPVEMDGVPAVQTPVAPGAEFTYEFVVPDAGTFWYHPHVRSDEQVERGLYGAFVVRSDAEPQTTSEHTVVLDDVLVDADWRLSPFAQMQAMVGRQGNVLLANGWANPIVSVTPNGLHRFRFINAANARYFNLALPGHRLIQIGTDGGFVPAPQEIDRLLLVPGERVDVLIVPDGDANATWMSKRYDRGHGTGELPDASIFQLAFTAPGETPSSIPTAFADVPALPAASLQRKLVLGESMGMAGGHAGHGPSDSEMGPVFSINGEVFPQSTALAATLDAVEEWSIVNDTEMDHPFHLHGFRFQIVASDGAEPRAWRDTINVPAGKTVKFRVRLEDNPGTWMFHCHILEHAERGMMGELKVCDLGDRVACAL